MLGLGAIGEGLRRIDMHDGAAAQRTLAIVAGLRLHPVDPAGRRQRADRQGAAGEQAAAAEGREESVQRTDFFEQFLGRGALPGQHVGVIVGRDQGQAMALRQVAADLLAIFRIAVIEHYLPAVATGRLDLHRRRVGRHHDGRRDPQQARREGDGLGVVAGGERHHPGGTLLGGKPRQRVEGAAELERSHALEVFAFEEDFRAEFFVEGTRGHHRRAVGMPGDPRSGGDHIVVGRQVVHGRLLGPWQRRQAGRQVTR